MTEISIKKQPATLTGLEECESFGEPGGALPLQTNTGFFEGELAKGQLYTGTLECKPGTLELDLKLTEFCYLLEGHWRFTSESGVVSKVRAGDSWVFAKGWKGTAEVIEKVRKIWTMMVPDEAA